MGLLSVLLSDGKFLKTAFLVTSDKLFEDFPTSNKLSVELKICLQAGIL
jgi:hypothetical protein